MQVTVYVRKPVIVVQWFTCARGTTADPTVGLCSTFLLACPPLTVKYFIIIYSLLVQTTQNIFLCSFLDRDLNIK